MSENISKTIANLSPQDQLDFWQGRLKRLREENGRLVRDARVYRYRVVLNEQHLVSDFTRDHAQLLLDTVRKAYSTGERARRCEEEIARLTKALHPEK